MKLLHSVLILVFILAMSVSAAEEAATEKAPSVDTVVLKDGSIVKGTINTMTGGNLAITTEFGGDVTVKWSSIKSINAVSPLSFVLDDGTVLKGTSDAGEAGSINVSSQKIKGAANISLDSVTAINPPKVKPVTYKGNINAGVSISDGNTRTKSGSLLGAFEARSKRQRLTLTGSTNYAENNKVLSQRNSRGALKYDFFATDRLYVFANAFLEGDYFQDLKLRTALSGGPGYQLIEKGDFDNCMSAMELYTEAGVAFFNEDFRSVPDESYVSGRWAAKLDWPFMPDKMSLFHNHEGYPGFEDIKDLYITTEQGLRFNLMENMNATAQVNWRYDSTPAAGFKKTDTLYLFTIGYNFSL